MWLKGAQNGLLLSSGMETRIEESEETKKNRAVPGGTQSKEWISSAYQTGLKKRVSRWEQIMGFTR